MAYKSRDLGYTLVGNGGLQWNLVEYLPIFKLRQKFKGLTPTSNF